MQLPAEICDVMHDNSTSDFAKNLSAAAQKKASLILVGKPIVESLIPMILCLFLGPWSDKYGRKKIILFPFIGE